MLAPYSNYIKMYVLVRSQTVGAAMSRTAPTAIPLLCGCYSALVLLFFCAILFHVPLVFCCHSAVIQCIVIRLCSMFCCYRADGFLYKMYVCCIVAWTSSIPIPILQESDILRLQHFTVTDPTIYIYIYIYIVFLSYPFEAVMKLGTDYPIRCGIE